MEELLDQIKEHLRGPMNYLTNTFAYSEAAVLLSMFVGVMILLAIANRFIRKYRRQKRGNKMPYEKRHLRRARARRRVLSIAANGACSSLIDAYAEGVVTRDEMNWVYRLFAHQCGMWDLLPRRLVVHPDPDDLKKEIKQRRASGMYAPVKLPDLASARPVPSLKRKTAA